MSVVEGARTTAARVSYTEEWGPATTALKGEVELGPGLLNCVVARILIHWTYLVIYMSAKG